jgi:hypothetical protein
MEEKDRRERPLHLVLMPDGRRLTYYEGYNGSHYVYDHGKRIHGTIETNIDAIIFLPETKE